MFITLLRCSVCCSEKWCKHTHIHKGVLNAKVWFGCLLLFGLLIHHRWEPEERRDTGGKREQSESPLSIFQRGDERTGSVEEAKARESRSDREEDEKTERDAEEERGE